MEENDELVCDCSNLRKSEIIEIVLNYWNKTITSVDGTMYGVKNCPKCKEKVRKIISEIMVKNQAFMHYY